ncbi:MAG: hypothetical protein OEX14_02630 [Paracoccaceae bacterium]|nr:hypothetical protein [Paracoccaceae bacterium]
MVCKTLVAIGLHVASWHSAPGFNGTNPGVYGRWDCNTQAGAFWNSESRVSAYGAYTWEYEKWNLRPFVSVGAVTGYKVSPVLPLATAGVGYDFGDTTFRVAYLPGGFAKIPHTVHFFIEKRF